MVEDRGNKDIMCHVQLSSTGTRKSVRMSLWVIWIEKPQTATKLDTDAPSTVSPTNLAKCKTEASGDSNLSRSSGNTPAGASSFI